MTQERTTPPHPVLSSYYHDAASRQGFVRGLFDRTASHYDRINAIFSLGSGRWYRRWMLKRVGLKAGDRLLDVATGTGLVAREASRIAGMNAVIGLDMSPGMLAKCRQHLPIALVQADAQRLPFPDGHFDFLSMGYALRHVSDLRATFMAYCRVLKPGGRVLILEIGRARRPFVQALLRFYLGRVVPLLSGVAASRDSRQLMEYYWDTIAECVPPEDIVRTLRQAGFENVQHYTSLGVFHAYAGTAPGAPPHGQAR
ncbi:class I SAM-dependent methyltransferase [Acetobacter sp. TBRC 12305]|uniref:Ubiquinone/menaquinone biosynthesis C-methyltransferase UbiE n=2 Tax=Acetobacter garciniae TaxID=2817435 RepID=A0A939KQ30_9PROT|nr:class I SAM-dependent methyltransferase [Acetobacter garciniae]MBO1324789.1 class I SAM-dependent methyltransferase [Acetobacter garciniae]MBX0344480.1 class I SAM-dependent methyltransferase [Acetobacter garciniae]